MVFSVEAILRVHAAPVGKSEIPSVGGFGESEGDFFCGSRIDHLHAFRVFLPVGGVGIEFAFDDVFPGKVDGFVLPRIGPYPGLRLPELYFCLPA